MQASSVRQSLIETTLYLDESEGLSVAHNFAGEVRW